MDEAGTGIPWAWAGIWSVVGYFGGIGVAVALFGQNWEVLVVSKRNIRVLIRCGATTCASSYGVFCRFLRVVVTGHNPECSLFDVSLCDAEGDIYGWLLRCEACMGADMGEGS